MLYEIHLPEVKLMEKDGSRGLFAIEPLLPGYGLTLGNSLRRVILSSLPGAAATQVKIVGATHEFTHIKDVKEDVVQIMLALKQIRFRMHSDEAQTCTIKITGKKAVKAKDIECPSGVEIVNKDLHIATLTSDKARLNLEIKVEKGRGYDPVENRQNERIESGVILLDAIYSPVKKVRFSVEATRVGQMTNLDKLMMEIETDGTIEPEEVVKQAGEILVEHFTLISGREVARSVAFGGKKDEDDQVSKIMVEEINLSPRTTNALLKNNVKTVGDIKKIPAMELRTLKGFGSKAYDELRDKLMELGVTLEEIDDEVVGE